LRTFTVAAIWPNNIFVLMRIDERASSVLIVEDNVRLVALLERALREHGFVVRAERDRESALVSALANEPDVFILDIGLRRPNDGIELIQELRARGIGAPALMLTGRNDVEDRVAGLNAGADDYLGKPFEVDELIARIQALLRRARGAERTPRLVVGNLALDQTTGEVHRGRRRLALTQREFAVLRYFMRHPGKELARRAIAEEVWGGLPPSRETTNIVDVYVNYLRKKLGAQGEEPMLHTVRGVGYVLRAPEPPRSRSQKGRKKEGGSAPPSRSSRR
jgi:two-component system response regulator MprA